MGFTDYTTWNHCCGFGKSQKNIIVEYYEYFRDISLIALIFTRFVKNTEPESGAREGEETGRSGRNFETDVFV